MATTKSDFLSWMAGWAVTETEGKWLTAYKMAAVQHETPGELILFVKQGPRVWHAFFRERATGSGTTPRAAIEGGGLGDVIDTDAEVRGYCRLIMNAPRRFVTQFAGLYEAQAQCSAE